MTSSRIDQLEDLLQEARSRLHPYLYEPFPDMDMVNLLKREIRAIERNISTEIAIHNDSQADYDQSDAWFENGCR